MSAERLEREAKDLRALGLVRQGFTYEEIARRIGVSGRGTAYKMAHRGLEASLGESLEQYLSLEILRMDMVIVFIGRRFRTVKAGTPEFRRLVRRFIEARRHFGHLIELEEGGTRPDLPRDFQSFDTLDDVTEEFTLAELLGFHAHCADKRERASRRPGEAAHCGSGAQISRDLRAARLRVEGMTFQAIADEMGVANRSVAYKMVARGAERASRRSPIGVVASEQDRLRTIELDLFNEISPVDLEIGIWIRKVRQYTQISRARCELLGLFPRKRKQLRPAVLGPISLDVWIETTETWLTLMIWERRNALIETVENTRSAS
jgi:transposase